MLCPEVFNFKAPPSVFQSSRVDKEYCIKKISEFNFVHSVTVILPDVLSVPDDFGADLSSCDYYRVNKLNIDELVNPSFLENFIKSGKVNLLSVDTRIDCEDCAAVTSCGNLILHLNKLTFQTLGIEGKLSRFHKKSKDKYIVKVDLKSEALKPGKAYYERVKSCLQILHFDVIVQWEPPSKNICPSSIAKYFFDVGKKVKLCKIKLDSETIFNEKMPLISSFDNFDRADLIQFIEWLGMVTINGNMQEEPDYISTYSVPEPTMRIGRIKILRWRGFFNSSKVTDFLQEIGSNYSKSTFWKAVYFQGFSDAPVVWGLNEHHFYTNGDNGGLVLLNKNEIYLCTQKCSNKCYK